MSYKVLVTDSYKKKVKRFFKKHPELFKRYEKVLLIMESNPFHPSLRLHKLQGKLSEFYSVSINMEYRVVIDLIIENEKIIPIDIGSHDEVY